MTEYLDYEGLQEFKQQNDLAYSLPEATVKEYYTLMGWTPQGNWFDEFYHIDLSSINTGSMFIFAPNEDMYYSCEYSYDNGLLPMFSEVGNFGTCGGRETAEPQGNYIELTVTGYQGENYSTRSIALHAGGYYLARKDSATKITIYLTGIQLPYKSGETSIFVQNENGVIETFGWNVSEDISYGSLQLYNGKIIATRGSLPDLDAPTEYYNNKYLGVTGYGYDFIDLPIPKPTTADNGKTLEVISGKLAYADSPVPKPTAANNGQVLGVVNGKLAYVDPPASSDLANVTEATF